MCKVSEDFYCEDKIVMMVVTANQNCTAIWFCGIITAGPL